MTYTKDYDGTASAIITDAYVFEGEPIQPGTKYIGTTTFSH